MRLLLVRLVAQRVRIAGVCLVLQPQIGKLGCCCRRSMMLSNPANPTATMLRLRAKHQSRPAGGYQIGLGEEHPDGTRTVHLHGDSTKPGTVWPAIEHLFVLGPDSAARMRTANLVAVAAFSLSCCLCSRRGPDSSQAQRIWGTCGKTPAGETKPVARSVTFLAFHCFLSRLRATDAGANGPQARRANPAGPWAVGLGLSGGWINHLPACPGMVAPMAPAQLGKGACRRRFVPSLFHVPPRRCRMCSPVSLLRTRLLLGVTPPRLPVHPSILLCCPPQHRGKPTSPKALLSITTPGHSTRPFIFHTSRRRSPDGN